jgi:hypothetical protein
MQMRSCAANREGRSRFDFAAELHGCRARDPEIPEIAIAYDEDLIEKVCSGLGMPVTQPIHYGAWCGRDESTSGQDIVVATKAGCDLEDEQGA